MKLRLIEVKEGFRTYFVVQKYHPPKKFLWFSWGDYWKAYTEKYHDDTGYNTEKFYSKNLGDALIMYKDIVSHNSGIKIVEVKEEHDTTS